MTWTDVILVAWVALSALVGARRGLTAHLFSLVGLTGGALAGSRIAPHLLSGGARSPWVPVASLIGALVGAFVLQAAAGLLGGVVRGFVVRGPLRLVDAAGGVAAGAAVGLALAWLAGAAALQLPGLSLRRHVQGSTILPALMEALPPATVLRALRRVDVLPLLSGLPDGRLPPPDASVLESPAARAGAASVVKVEGTACGLGVQGSGWVIRRGLVATNAHVVSGQRDTRVLARDGQALRARAVYVDSANDVALLRVPALQQAPLGVALRPPGGDPVVLLGYAENGPLVAVAGTAGQPTKILAPGAYGGRPRLRTVVPLRGPVRPGDSGGPVLNRSGRVVSMIFGATRREQGGFGVPVETILRGLDSPLDPVPPGPCVG